MVALITLRIFVDVVNRECGGKRNPQFLRCGFVVHVCEIGCLIDLTLATD